MLCSASPACIVESCSGVEHIFACVPIPFFNASIVTGRDHSAASLDGLGRSALEWAAPRGVPWLLVVTRETLQPGIDAAATLDRCGFAPLMALTGMVAEEVASSPPPAGLAVRTAASDADCVAIFDVNAAAYEMDFNAANPIWGRRAWWQNHSVSLGYIEDRAVSAAAVLMVEGYRYVALVATVPGQRRRGFADAAMRHALEESRRCNGDSPTFLHATEAGRPVYERMGYRPVSTHDIFIEKRFLASH